MNSPVNPVQRWKAVVPLLAMMPALIIPIIRAFGGKSAILFFLGVWLLAFGIALQVARRRFGAKITVAIPILLGITGALAISLGCYLHYFATI